MISISLFRYKIDGNGAEEGWYSPSFNGDWPSGAIGNLPSPSGKVGYYCGRFDVNDTIGYASVKTVVNTRGGYRVFINGIETGRSFLPSGELTFESEPIEDSEIGRDLPLIISYEKGKIISDNNLLCIEVHTKSGNPDTSFSCSVSLQGSNDDLIVDGSLGYSHAGFNDGTWLEDYPNLYDKVTTNKWYVASSAISSGSDRSWLTWKWNDNRSQVVNYWKLYGGNMSNRVPYNIAIYGTHDDCGSGLASSHADITWNMLYQGNPASYIYTSNNHYDERTFTNTVAYRCYKMEFWGSESEGIEIGEFYLGMRSTVNVNRNQIGVGSLRTI